ncbi:MAG: ABC transporter ATP-binding protein [Anaerolineaceae bacterium]|nr:ABC transporter ATP-binding protein [Anaerolineaceae bacterium]
MANPSSIALSIDAIHVHYGLSHVLQETQLSVAEGSITAILGRNGVGKTTLINSIMGLLPITSGQIMLYRGGSTVDLAQQRAADRKKLGIALVPQGRRLFRSLSVEEHLNLVDPIKAMPYNLQAIYEIFPRLYERRRAGASTLSGGEQSMLAVARALILNPDILLMDEPTEGLAPLLVEAIGRIVVGLKDAGLTVLLVEQKLKFALNVADHIAVMERGRILNTYARNQIQDVDALSEIILSGTITQ